MHGLDPAAGGRPAPEPDGRRRRGADAGRHDRLEEALDGADRERAVELARFALEGDRLLAVDNGLFWIVAADGAACSPTTTSGRLLERARAQAHARGSLFTVLSVNLWRVLAVAPR